MALRLGFAWADARALYVGGYTCCGLACILARLRRVEPRAYIFWWRGRGFNALCAVVRRRETLVGCLYRRGVEMAVTVILGACVAATGCGWWSTRPVGGKGGY